MSNYPEDIRQYDDDPRSPFYVEPPEDDEEVSDKEDFDEAASQEAYYHAKYGD